MKYFFLLRISIFSRVFIPVVIQDLSEQTNTEVEQNSDHFQPSFQSGNKQRGQAGCWRGQGDQMCL
jgi:hypothetical protein